MNKEIRIAVIGLGYVGLPLARLFATKFPVIEFDINSTRVGELRNGHDSTLEVEDEILQSVLLKTYPVPAKQLNGEVLEFADAENSTKELEPRPPHPDYMLPLTWETSWTATTTSSPFPPQ